MEYHTASPNRIDRVNALVVALLLFIYGLTIPLNLSLSTNASIPLICILLGGYAVLVGLHKIKLSMLIVVLIPILLLLSKIPFEYSVTDSEGNLALAMLISFLTIGTFGVICGSLRFCYQSFIRYGLVLSWVNFFAIFYFPFTAYYYNGDVNYMRFGYALLPSVVFAFCYLNLETKFKLSTATLLFFSLSLLLIFGARGASLTFVVFLIFYVYVFRISKKLIWIFTLSLLFLTVFASTIIMGLAEILEQLGIQSYAVDKMQMLITGVSITSVSSGRDYFYEAALARFYENPFIGDAINSVYIDLRSTYYHNVFLDLLANFGMLGFSTLIVFISIYIYDFSKISNKHKQVVFLILFILPMGRLLVSSTLWQRPEFWLFISFCVNHGRVVLFKKINHGRPKRAN